MGSLVETPAAIRQAVRKKTIAIGSGKGGTGKSTTALNVAVLFAKQNLKVGLLDLDPLSNLSTVLDIDHIVKKKYKGPLKPGLPFSSYVESALPRLDLVFPNPKTRKEERTGAMKDVLETLLPEFQKRYDVVLLDLPAGISAEENLIFLPYSDYLLVVTNPEPTAHVSSGGFIKAALQINPALNVFLWHNRYKPSVTPGFDSINVIQNYNIYAPEELKISAREAQTVKSIAFIPRDPSLDLLQNIISPAMTVQVKMAETLAVLLEKLIDGIVEQSPLEGNIFLLVKYYIRHNRHIEDSGAYTEELLVYLNRLLKKSSPPTPKDEAAIRELVSNLRTHFLFLSANKALDALENSLEQIYEENRTFMTKGLIRFKLNPEDYVVQALKDCQEGGVSENPFIRHTAGLLLFYLAFHKLLAADAIIKLFLLFTPFRKDEEGGKVRDRRRQILRLLDKDKEYHNRYYALIRKLFPVTLIQLQRVANGQSLNKLLFLDRLGSLNRRAYIRLLTDLTHDCVNTGLGVASGYKFNIASAAIKKGAKELLKRIQTNGR